MIIETIAIVGLTFATTTLVAKEYERHHDALYGPYIQARAHHSDLPLFLRLISESFSRLGWRARGAVYLAALIAR